MCLQAFSAFLPTPTSNPAMDNRLSLWDEEVNISWLDPPWLSLAEGSSTAKSHEETVKSPEYLAAGRAPPHPPLGVTTNGSDKGSLASGLFFFFKVCVSMARLALRIY